VARDLGTIEPGKIADLVLFPADPIADSGSLRQVIWVMKGGVLYRPRDLRGGS
jgi:imidazolonepropionase-like amidohydrolase